MKAICADLDLKIQIVKASVLKIVNVSNIGAAPACGTSRNKTGSVMKEQNAK